MEENRILMRDHAKEQEQKCTNIGGLLDEGWLVVGIYVSGICLGMWGSHVSSRPNPTQRQYGEFNIPELHDLASAIL